MPSESDRPVEKLMRDYSAARKAAAAPDEFKLHPVTRNALKVELVKEYGRRLPGGESRPSVRAAFWPKLAMAGGGLFVVGLLIVFTFSSKPQPDGDVLVIAKHESGLVAPIEDSSDALLPRPEKVPIAIVTKRPPSPKSPVALVAEGATVFQFYARTGIAPVGDSAPNSVQVTTAAPRAINSSAPARAISQQSAERVSSVPNETVTKSSPPTVTKPLLATFQFRISGDEVVVIDQDQSRYVGRIRPIDPNLLRRIPPPTVSADLLADTGDPQFPTNYRLYSEQGGGRPGMPPAGQFTVTGTNLTTRQRVTFTGRMVTWTETDSAAESSVRSPPSTLLQIEGSATLGAEPTVLINATTKP